MPQIRLLHVDATQLRAYRWQHGQPEQEQRFSNDPAGFSAFSAYLLQRRGSIFHLLADAQEEGFSYALIPFAHGADRRALIERKLSQLFFGSNLTAALSYGREKTGRRDERVLFMALTRPQMFDPWLAALRAAEAQLAGIHSTPVLCQALVERLRLAAGRDHLLVITFGAAGVRQTYFEGGNLRFSRLSATTAGADAERAQACAVESAKIYQYLVSQRILARGAALPTLVVRHPAQRELFAAACRSTADLAFEFIDITAAASAYKYEGALTGSSADPLLLQLLAQRPPRTQFAHEPERHLHQVGRVRFGLLSAGAVILFGCMLAAAKHLFEIHSVRERTAAVLVEADHDSRRYAEILRGLPKMPTSLENLRAVVNRFETLQRRSAPMEAMLERLSRAFDESVDVRLERLEWQLTTRPDEPAVPAPAKPTSTSTQDESDMYAVAVVACSLPQIRSEEKRRIMKTIDDFVATLQSQPRLRAAIVRPPFDIESGKVLKSGGTSATEAAMPQFVIRVSYPL